MPTLITQCPSSVVAPDQSGQVDCGVHWTLLA